MAVTPNNTARLECRLSEETKAIIDQAARFVGQTTTGFVVSTLAERAREVIAQHTVTRVSSRDWDTINALLDSDAEPDAHLSRAVARFKTRRP